MIFDGEEYYIKFGETDQKEERAKVIKNVKIYKRLVNREYKQIENRDGSYEYMKGR